MVVESDMPSIFHDRCRSMTPQLILRSDSKRDSYDEEVKAECSSYKTESEHGPRDRSHRYNRPEDLYGNICKNKRESNNLWTTIAEIYLKSSTEKSSRLEQDHDRSEKKSFNGDEKLRFFRLVNYRFRTEVTSVFLETNSDVNFMDAGYEATL